VDGVAPASDARRGRSEMERAETASFRSPRTSRRWFLCGTAGACLLAARPLTAGTALPPDTTFRIVRKGVDVGRHRIAFRPDGTGFCVDADVDLAVKVAFVTVFRYSQSGQDRWQDDMLVESRYVTDDDGTKSSLEARAEQSRFVVEGSSGRLVLPLGTMTDMCFWNEGIVRAPQIVDSQTGQAGKLYTRCDPNESVSIGGQWVGATRYLIDARNGRSGSVWYDSAGRWIKADFKTRGEHISYELI
jgi:hypothetical protein